MMVPLSAVPVDGGLSESDTTGHSGASAKRTGTATSISTSRLVDIDDLAEWLATTPRHVRRLVAERRVPFVKVGHFVRFDPKDIAHWIEKQKVLFEPK
jgi:excisionase family DNA binding protein